MSNMAVPGKALHMQPSSSSSHTEGSRPTAWGLRPGPERLWAGLRSWPILDICSGTRGRDPIKI